MEAEPNSTAAATAATAEQWNSQAVHAMHEAIVVTDSVAYMLTQLDNELGNPPEAMVPLEIIRACLSRLSAAVDPAVTTALKLNLFTHSPEA